MEFHVEGMTCGGCARSVTKAIELVDPAATVSADAPSRRVQVQTSASEAQIIAALTEAGFPPRPA
ncbi:heavy-metal-associated domain-containing protein [Stenotrophomonas indicatrix]|uniref:heavy-metal-associated domain-containing protein n=1 Tax=Stenotrophomonas indicatrix TaxID=2045451 RepID=UPI001CBA928F|nr:heavy-metal-associated domain-containing protein [Stenotrophomonas indicatrix]